MSGWMITVFLLVAVNTAWMIATGRRRKKEEQKLQEAADLVAGMIRGEENKRLPAENEGAVSRLFHEVNSLAAVLSAHADNRSRANEFLKDAIGDISHQLKTPLAALNIYIGILQDEELSKEERNRFVDLAEAELERMELLVANLLKLTKLDSGMIEFSEREESAEEMILELRERFFVRAEREHKKILLETEEVSCFCDRVWTMEALGNLLKNALDHTEEGGCICLRCKTSGAECLFSVEDNGEGIEEEELYRIFTRFYRSPSSKDSQGVGLGLPLAKTIVEKQKGSVEVESTCGNGSVFHVFLPLSYRTVGEDSAECNIPSV